MSKSIVVIICLIASICFLLLDSAEARCRKSDRGCCRKRVEYGRCHKHVRRWAYNVTCGQCTQFDYSGCGGDENNFENQDDCQNCCKGTSPCPKYTLSRPPPSCEYKWEDAADSCPRPRLDCKCRESHCRPDSCRIGERCLAERTHRPCNKCPCPQYRCVTDPCYAVAKQLRPCEKCVSVPSPKCNNNDHCPLVAYRENHCPAPVVVERPPQPQPRYHHCNLSFPVRLKAILAPIVVVHLIPKRNVKSIHAIVVNIIGISAKEKRATTTNAITIITIAANRLK